MPKRSPARPWTSPPISASTPTTISSSRSSESVMGNDFSPREIVSELDKHIVGQQDAKRAVAIALRNRWRRLQLPEALREEVLPKNILMIGPTGCGKTEIARRLAKLANAPFLKVEATKFTEVGYVGRDVEQIARDLMEAAIDMARERLRKDVRAKAEMAAEDRVLDALCGSGASEETRLRFRHKLRSGELNEREIEVEVADSGAPMQFEVPGQPGASVGMINLSDMLGKAFGGRTKKRKMTVSESYETLMREESDKLLDQEKVVREARDSVEQNGIVFIDEIDKITARSEFRGGGDVSREGVQRDLLPLIEGTTVNTKHGPVKTDHVLFICSGAFHMAKPSDMLPCSSGNMSEGLAMWKAPEQMNSTWSVFTGPCLVFTVVPSINGSRSRCTPSRLPSPPPRNSLRAVILSISSMKTMPFCSTDSRASRTTRS